MERTGEERLDRLIERFARSNGQLADPEFACGRCHLAARRFQRFLAKAEVLSLTLNETPDRLGYTDRPQESFYRPGQAYSYHTVVAVESISGLFLIDWSASQFGYGEFPLIQRLSADGTIERQWQGWSEWPEGLLDYSDDEVEGIDSLQLAAIAQL